MPHGLRDDDDSSQPAAASPADRAPSRRRHRAGCLSGCSKRCYARRLDPRLVARSDAQLARARGQLREQSGAVSPRRGGHGRFGGVGGTVLRETVADKNYSVAWDGGLDEVLAIVVLAELLMAGIVAAVLAQKNLRRERRLVLSHDNPQAHSRRSAARQSSACCTCQRISRACAFARQLSAQCSAFTTSPRSQHSCARNSWVLTASCRD